MSTHPFNTSTQGSRVTGLEPHRSPLAPAAHRVERVLGGLLVVLMSFMVLDVTWQVSSRYLLRAPSSFTEELAGFLLIWIGLLGAAYGIRTRAHPGIDLLVSRLPGGFQRAAELLSHLLVLLFALATMVGGGIWLVRLAFRLDQISAALGLPMWIVYMALPLSGLLVTLFSLEALLRRGKGEGTEGEPAGRTRQATA